MHITLFLPITLTSINSDKPTVSSQQIKRSPSINVLEGDDASITCEMPVSRQGVSLYPRWILDGSQIADAPLVISSNQSIQLKSGSTLPVIVMIHNDMNFGDIMHNGTISEELTSFSIMLLNVTSEINGLSVNCTVWWEEKNITLFYTQTAVVAVTTKNKCK